MPRRKRKNPPHSEMRAWGEVYGHAEDIRRMVTGPAGRIDVARLALAAEDLISLAMEMQSQLQRGMHENPGLVIWPNPGSMMAITFDKLLSRRAIALQYKHVADKLDYQHDFDPGVDVITAETDNGQKVVVLSARDGRELWADF